jgi:signal transduction histidine kinase
MSDNDLKIQVIIFIAVMLLLFASFLVAFIFNQRKKYQFHRDVQLLKEQQQNQLIEAAVRSEELERHRIAETLHDEVGAILSSSRLHIENIKTVTLDKRDKELHAKGKELLDEGIGMVRNISHNLHSNILKEFGLNEAIRHFINKTLKGSLVKTETRLDPYYATLNADNDISIYRMIQELVNNILKHAHPKELIIASTLNKQFLELKIMHDGDGLTQHQLEKLRFNKEGLGLKNIMNRVILLRGSILFEKDDKRSMIKIIIPNKSNQP